MWWRDITREALLEGKHTIAVKNALRFAFALFIVSEVMFFFTFFWGYYHNVSNPIWLIMPPEMIIKGWGIPMLNTAILLSSGAAVTWAHHATICAKDIMKKAPK
jgi:cytochrome c oxidase subunit 3